MAREEGIRGLYRGTTANLAKLVPYAGLMFVGFELATKFFVWLHDDSKS